MAWPTKAQKEAQAKAKQQGKKPVVAVDAMKVINEMVNKAERQSPQGAATATTEEVTTMQQNAQPVTSEATPPTNAATAEGQLSQIDELRKAKRVKIIIDEQDNQEGHKDVHLAINGYVLTIQRGKAVDVPEPFAQLLENLKYTIISKSEDGEDITREVPRYHWRRVAA